MQPFEGSVTVTVYVFAAETVLAAVMMPPPQLKVAPPVVDDAVNVSETMLHVKTDGDDTLALGEVVFWVTVTDAELVQPLAGLVTVTV